MIAATATQLSYLHRAFRPNFTFDSYPYITCTQVVQAVSVATACIPYLQPFLESLNTGLLWKDDLQSQAPLSSVIAKYGHSRGRELRDYTNIEAQRGLSGEGIELETVRDRYERNIVTERQELEC